LSHDEIIRLCGFLHVRTKKLICENEEEGGIYDKEFLIEALIQKFEKRMSQIDAINAMPLYPDEVIYNFILLYFIYMVFF
jgi:intron-binding protein aquarius